MKHLLIIIIASMVVMTSSACEEPVPDELPQLIGSFNDDNRLEINQKAGECVIKAYKGDLIFVNVSYDYSTSCYSPTFIEIDSTLFVGEKFSEDNCEGSSELFFRVPSPFGIIFTTVSSNFSITWGRGYYNLKSLSGDFSVDSLAGTLDVNTASGNIQLNEVIIESESFFSSASGNVIVSLAQSPVSNINMSGVSGDIVLNYKGNAVEGYFEFTARKDLGSIISPYPFDLEEEFKADGIVYMKKSLSRGGDMPRIIFATESGTVQLKLN